MGTLLEVSCPVASWPAVSSGAAAVQVGRVVWGSVIGSSSMGGRGGLGGPLGLGAAHLHKVGSVGIPDGAEVAVTEPAHAANPDGRQDPRPDPAVHRPRRDPVVLGDLAPHQVAVVR